MTSRQLLGRFQTLSDGCIKVGHTLLHLYSGHRNILTTNNPRLPEAFFVTRLSKGGGYHLSLDFRYKESDSYDFGTRG